MGGRGALCEARDTRQDLIGGLGPREGLGIGVVRIEKRPAFLGVLPGAAGALKKNVRVHRFFLRRSFGLPTSQGRGGLGSMDSTLALPDIRSLSNRKGRGQRSGGREREYRRAGEGD